MSNKEIFKKMYSEKINKEKIFNNVLKQIEEKNIKKNNMLKLAIIPVCLIVVICGVLVFSNNKSENLYLKNNNDIIINKINNLGETKLDANIKEIPTNGVYIPWIEVLSGVNIPNDLDKFNGYGIYTRKDASSEYDILNCYVYDYFNLDSNRNIKISFSDKNKPIRDYYFSEEGAKKSNINNYELIIYQYRESYFTEFKYEDYNFDIETRNISEREFIMFLKSILK